MKIMNYLMKQKNTIIRNFTTKFARPLTQRHFQSLAQIYWLVQWIKTPFQNRITET